MTARVSGKRRRRQSGQICAQCSILAPGAVSACMKGGSTPFIFPSLLQHNSTNLHLRRCSLFFREILTQRANETQKWMYDERRRSTTGGGSQIGMFGLNPSCSPTASTVHLPIRCRRPTFLPHRRSPKEYFSSHAPKAKPARQIEEASLAQGATTRDQESKQSLCVTNSTKSRFFLPS